MKRIEVRLNLKAVAPLLDVIKAAIDGLRPRLAVDQQMPGHDAELATHWRDDLLKSQGDDFDVLLALFDRDFFLTGMVVFDEENAEPVLRSCSAVRLHLRAAHLQTLGDEILESSEVAPDELPGPQRRAFATYVFLATLQEIIVQHLDPTIPEE
ncbi:MAG: hypothetical protein ACHQ5A_08165 [Opitutales bacterium]